ncbi:MAG: lysylphosphatidylglycerol synthase transmembrane domain-containing protein [Veillonellaceae bacterium]|nr:lysylphosphatidylglycerol synthase transmembrane domain-containing protein [Veillonellaceae bacterium]
MHIKVPIVEAGGIYLSGISMGVTPGKSGEILKSYLLEKKLNIPFMISAPTLLSERLTGIMGCFAFGRQLVNICIVYRNGCIVDFITVVLIFCHDGLRNWTVNWLCRWKMLARHKCQIENFYNSSFKLMGTRVVCVGTLFSMSYWMMEVMVFYSLLEGMNAMLELPQVMLLLTSVSIGGGLTMLPGSIGALEGGLMGMLAYMGTDRAVAGGAVLLHRFLCMWFPVMIGAMVLCARYRKFLY